MLSVASVNIDWGIITRPNKLESIWIMLNAIAYVAFSNLSHFNISLKTFLASGYIQRAVHFIENSKEKVFQSTLPAFSLITSHSVFAMQEYEQMSVGDCRHA